MFTQVHWTEISRHGFSVLNKNSCFKTYWSTTNASSPYIPDCKWGLACPGSYLYLPADAGRTLFPWGGFTPSIVLNHFGFLFWSIYQQRSKANFLRFQASVLVGRRGSYQDSLFQAEGCYHWALEKCPHIPTVSHTIVSCFFLSNKWYPFRKNSSILTSS